MLPADDLTDTNGLSGAEYLRRAQEFDAKHAPSATGRDVRLAGVIGAGTMGSGIAMSLLAAGFPVTLVETNREVLQRGTATIARLFESDVSKGRLTAEQAARAQERLHLTLAFGNLAQCDLIVEAAFEDMALKLDIFARLGRIAKSGAILASNTSFLNIDAMAERSGRACDVLGMHFFSPAHIMKLVEVVRGRHTSEEALATVVNVARTLGKVPVVCRVGWGFIGNRMLMQRQWQATELLLDGASPEDIDRVHTDFGMPMGPFQMADLAGLDIGWHRDPARIETLVDAFCARGRWGQKTRAGFYDYPEPRNPQPSAVTAETLSEFRHRSGRISRSIGKDEVTARTMYTMINEGAKLLEEGVAERASDIDLVWHFGFGWPKDKGGPMFWAEQIGWGTVLEGLERYREYLPANFSISLRLKQYTDASQPIA